ncbi:MAG: phosphoglycerate dehydrogenase [Thermoguttaceae bacterium]|nr:phosphoglycerate dehydrogenase [Thermoguttaceae bacterium]MDW8078466.1 phosphoglycerate dehydrogenase [Thermoguttaceae bacterium]
MPRVLILDPLSEGGIKALREAGLDVEERHGLKGESLKEALLLADGAICRSGVKITREALEGNRRLRVIVRAGVGVDNIDLEAATRQGILVMNTPGGNTIATAEHTLALMFALARRICPAYRSLQEGRWERNRFLGTELYGKVLGVVGLGRVGRAVAERAKALGMRVLGYDPFVSAAKAREWGVELVNSLRELLPQVDFLSLHVPLTEQTRNLIGREELALMKRGARLVNCARGGIVDETALLEALDSGHLAGVALDVFEKEPCTQSPLFGRENVVCTPHLGASTQEAQEQVAVEAAELIVDYFTRGVVRQAVNSVALDGELLRELGGYLNVAYRLGLLLAQVQGEGIRRCRIRYQGEVARRETRLLTAAFAAGLLEQAVEEPVNLVNAEWLLRQRGVELLEERSGEVGDFSSLVRAEVESSERTAVAAGTLFGKMPRLVQKRSFRLDAPLEGILLLFEHKDVPGVIGHIGTVFGRHQVNIAGMSVGREWDRPGGPAVGVLCLDSYPPAEALREVLAHEAMSWAKIVRLPSRDRLPSWLAGSQAGASNPTD